MISSNIKYAWRQMVCRHGEAALMLYMGAIGIMIVSVAGFALYATGTVPSQIPPQHTVPPAPPQILVVDDAR
ncbi:MAG TPA: hypothetical protein VLG40_03595 [Candidatus Saccharimonas sp.]|nr:hypothetical protein [Candidatus Saccharimonas sp.]